MRKLLLVAAFAITVLVATSSTASAFPLRGAPGGNITATGLSFTVEGPLGVNVICDVTMNGSLATSVARSGGSAGNISNVDVSNCNYPVTVLDATPWPITALTLLYGTSLTGVLNRISGIGFNVNLGALGNCLFSGTINFLLAVGAGGVTPASGAITTLSSTLTSGCLFVTGRVVAGQRFNLSPQQTIARA